MELKKLFIGDTNNTFIQFFRYLFVGGLAFVVDYGLMVLFSEIFGIYPVLSAALSFIAGLAVNYLLSTFWIFKNSKIKNRFAEFGAFAVIGIIGLMINSLIIWFFQAILGANLVFGSLLPANEYYKVGKLFSTVIVFIWNFLARKIFLFNKKEDN